MTRKRIADSLSYANIVATLALFVALGGASYAAVVLPAHSVGPRQLRAKAVHRRSLSFPLGTASITDHETEEISNGPCNGPPVPGVKVRCVVACSVSCAASHGLDISVRAPGRLSITAVAGLKDHGAAQATADVGVRVIVDGHVVSRVHTEMSGGQLVQVPAQAQVSVAAGAHTVGLSIEASYSARPENILVGPVSIIATALPRAPRTHHR